MAKEIDKSGERWLGLLRQNLNLDLDILRTMPIDEVIDELKDLGAGPEDIQVQTKKVQELVRGPVHDPMEGAALGEPRPAAPQLSTLKPKRESGTKSSSGGPSSTANTREASSRTEELFEGIEMEEKSEQSAQRDLPVVHRDKEKETVTREPVRKSKTRTWPTWMKVVFVVTALLGAAFVFYILVIRGSVTGDESRYNFEEAGVVWDVSSDASIGRSLKNPELSTQYATKGESSMRVQVILDGTEEGMNQGEVFVDFRLQLPRGISENTDLMSGLDLINRRISAALFLPSDSLIARDSARPTYAQLFQEECRTGQRRMLSHQDLDHTGRYLLKGTVDSSIRETCLIRIKVGMNPEDRNRYEGYIYIDAVDW